jgi:hypothetical protein
MGFVFCVPFCGWNRQAGSLPAKPVFPPPGCRHRRRPRATGPSPKRPGLLPTRPVGEGDKLRSCPDQGAGGSPDHPEGSARRRSVAPAPAIHGPFGEMAPATRGSRTHGPWLPGGTVWHWEALSGTGGQRRVGRPPAGPARFGEREKKNLPKQRSRPTPWADPQPAGGRLPGRSPAGKKLAKNW